MKPEIKEYAEAFEAHLNAKKSEISSRDAVRRTHHRLMLAKDALRNAEHDILEDTERL